MNNVEYKRKSKFAVVVVVILFFIFSALVYYQSLLQPVTTKSDATLKIVNIPKGYSTVEIAKVLKKNNLIKNEWFFIWRAKVLGADGKLQAGKYLLSPNMTPDDIIKKIFEGKAQKDTIKVTIPEGYTVKDIANKLSQLGLVNKDKFLEISQNDTFNYDFLKDVPKDRPNRLEGYLFPDTYQIPIEADEKEIINIMLKRFQEVYNSNIKDIAKNIGMTPDQIVIIASMIEKEAVVDKDRPLIAGVIYNRLEKHMKLQIDATVQYALGKHKDKLLYKDLEVDSPYNTYQHYGLPIGPICNPGLKSIKAALFPAEHDFYYYVAKKDGSHIFSVTYEDHLKAQREIEASENNNVK
ncbi:endolytic transglycosylase MltG [Thermoanaerobacter thermocopriae]|uniref:endolytic transglycosylase MltG n=1 Tax=Thermoanaerobacter thermocopriae TaxID=29350 RepID=UPI00048ABA6D|nr:endolytic transglycosylase MltG [Thermoanaerobacter thermocopriae]